MAVETPVARRIRCAHAWAVMSRPSGATLEHQRKPRPPKLRVISLFEDLQPAELFGRSAGLCTMQACEKAHPDYGRAGPGRRDVFFNPGRFGSGSAAIRRPAAEVIFTEMHARRTFLRRILGRRPACRARRSIVALSDWPDGRACRSAKFFSRSLRSPCRHRGCDWSSSWLFKIRKMSERGLRSERAWACASAVRREPPAPGNRSARLSANGRRRPAGADPL